MGWQVPVWAHIPLIHGPDGKKLSKRHGAVSLTEYRDMGYPAAAMRNYLARLGWSHGDQEVFADAELRELFSLEGINKAPARLDMKKLDSISGRHIAATEDAALLHELERFLAATGRPPLDDRRRELMLMAMPHLKERAKTFVDLLEKANFVLAERPVGKDDKAAQALDSVSRGILAELTPQLRNASWSRDALEALATRAAEENGIKFGKLAAPLRAALAGRTVSPSVFDMMLVLGRDETLARLEDAAAGRN
jgi:glutamyl-tRNA synthetase